MNYKEAYKKLEEYKQLHILEYYDELSYYEQQELISQINETDFSVLNSYNHSKGHFEDGEIEPIEIMKLTKSKGKSDRYSSVGIEAIKEGKIALVLLAGGMGTRLGADIPKGMFNIGITRPIYIFERIINNIMDVVKETNTWIHLFVMTSNINHDTTIKFFKKNDYFGYNIDYITFFKQEMSPTTDFNGKVYMESKNKFSASPNGNGGWYKSLKENGLTDVNNKSRIEWINVFPVDNVLQRIAEPGFVGATIASDYDVGVKVVKKVSPEEKVGVICKRNKKPFIIEYYEMNDELLYKKDEDGEYLYNYGVILNYLFKVSTLDKIIEKDMPIHLANKKISYIDKDARLINPEKSNGYKYEILVLDMISMMDSCLAYEVERSKEFAPIKNRSGIDSVESARELLRENGIEL